MDEVSYLRHAGMRGFAVLRERNPRVQMEMIAGDVASLHEADLINGYELGEFGEPRLALVAGSVPLPPLARKMEQELLHRAFDAKRSLLSTHDRLPRELRELAHLCSAHGITTEVLLVRAFGENQGAFVAHWLGRERPTLPQQLSAFLTYWDSIGFAVASSRERVRVEHELGVLRQRAYYDRLTGLPNRFALDEELSVHERTEPLSMLVLDFDGMREANTALGYERGGDVLISTVGAGLRALAREGEFPARLHTAGDEFALVLPGLSDAAARRRAYEVETYLDALVVPDTHRDLYHGASVGYATRLAGESTHQMRHRATDAMRVRKQERQYSGEPQRSGDPFPSLQARLRPRLRPRTAGVPVRARRAGRRGRPRRTRSRVRPPALGPGA